MRTKIHDNVFIGEDVKIGEGCNIQFGAYIPDNVVICDNVFIGPHAVFANDKYPPSNGAWKRASVTMVMQGAVIGANATILPGIIIGRGAMIGAGCVVTKDVGDNETVVGNPARWL